MLNKIKSQRHIKNLSLLLVVVMLSFAAIPVVSFANEHGDMTTAESMESGLVNEEMAPAEEPADAVTSGSTEEGQVHEDATLTEEPGDMATPEATESGQINEDVITPATPAGIQPLEAETTTAAIDLHKDAEVHINNVKDLLDVLENGVANKIYLAAGTYQLASGLVGYYNAYTDTYSKAGYAYDWGYAYVARNIDFIGEGGEAILYNNPGYRHIFFGGDAQVLNFTNVKLVGNNGGGLHHVGSNSFTINNAVIENCTANDWTRGDFNGGAVKKQNGLLILNNCTFDGNKANWGGAVYAEVGASVNNCTFTNNTAKDASNAYNGYGGAIAYGEKLEVIGGTMSGNYADVMGGAIARPYSGVGSQIEGHVKGVLFENNTTSGNGGAIASISTKGFVIEECTFNGNQAMVNGGRGNGGAVFATSRGDMTIKNSTFTGNSGFFGGAVSMEPGTGNLIIENSNISGNRAVDNGGGVSAQNDGTLTFTNVILENNQVQGSNLAYGGGLYLENKSGATITDSKMNNNTAACGGGAYIESKGNVLFTNTEIAGNSAESAGGLYSGEFEATNTVTMIGGSIQNNAAGALGGGWFVYDGNAVANGTKIEGNTAGMNGGGLYVFLGSANLTGATLSDNESYYGGGAYVSDYTNYDVEINLTDSVVSGNKATYAGGIATFGPLTAVRTSFTNNAATSFAGTIMSDREGSISLTDSTVKGNTADLIAGIYATHLGNLKTENVNFSENDSRLGYAWRLDKADESDAFANLHKANILNTTYTQGYTNAYNNIDVYFTRENVSLTYKQNISDVTESGIQTSEAIPTYDNEKSDVVLAKPYMAVTLKDANDVADWTPEGKVFLGWSTERDGAIVDEMIMPQTDVTLYAIWSNPEEVTEPEPETPDVTTPETPDVTVPVVSPAPQPPAPPAPPAPVYTAPSVNAPAPVVAAPAPFQIGNNNTPLVGETNPGEWSLLNLVMAAMTTLLMLILLLGVRRNRRDEDRLITERKHLALRLVSILPAAAAIIFFLLVEDMTQMMTLINKFSIGFGLILILQTLITLAAVRGDEKEIKSI